jgi:DnaJ-class molecular chaperone
VVTILVLLVITSGAVMVLVVVKAIKEARESRQRRTTATPYGVLMAPTDAELRRTREVHPYSVYRDCPTCENDSKLKSKCENCKGEGQLLVYS